MAEEEWDDYKEQQRKRRAKRVPLRTQEIKSLIKEGFIVEQKTSYHFRINGRLDIWVTHNRYHDIKTNRRGGYPEVKNFVRRFFNGKHTHHTTE